MVEHVVETDVLVIGGGLSGCFAAIKAKERGVDVVLVDKGYVSKSGQTPWAHATGVFNPAWGHNLDAWMRQVYTVGEYINNRDWTETILLDSYARYQDLVSWGVEFLKDAKGEFVKERGRASEAIMMEPHDGRIGKFPPVLRRQVVKRGVTIMDRVMVTDLLTQDGRVVGAMGIPMDSLDVYIFKAKATVICAGAGGFKPWGAWPIAELTGDGHAMAYRVGAAITGKEFEDFHSRRAVIASRRAGGGPRRGARLVNAEGDAVTRNGMDFHAHAGRAPLFAELGDGMTRMVSGSAVGMSVHTTEGIWPTNMECATSVPGLYAAGDSLATMVVGARYAGMGFATATCSSTGARAGWGAAEYALQAEKQTVDEEKLKLMKKRIHVPIERKGGFSSNWVTQVLKNIMIPYFISRVKHGERMQAALTLVEFLRDHLVPKLTAKDPHELRLAHETKNMVLNAEMRLRASLFRTESRGMHYREDYPRRVDPDWLAWVLLKEKNGEMTAYKKPIVKAWWPDLSQPYEERYPVRFPGE
jgi:succinate dehydrogenase/fumarate reductase flavoprotein subunit